MASVRAVLSAIFTCAVVLTGAGCSDGSGSGNGDQDMMTGNPPGDLAMSMAGCNAGQTMCADGCRDLTKDPTSCGKCGMACAPGFACELGACQLACAGGTTKCVDACANLMSDNKHCGDCNTQCAGDTSCKAGVCSCPPNQVVCNGNCLDVRYDPNNCAMCNKLCAPGQVCNNGICEIPRCMPTGQRIPFGANVNNLSGCRGGNPCQGDAFVFDNVHQASFGAFGDSVTCPFANNVTACISNVGITTANLTTSCQGRWEVQCDGAVVGVIHTLNNTCVGSAMGNFCRTTFAPRPCTSVKLVAVQDGDMNAMACCGMTGQPDSVVTSISAW